MLSRSLTFKPALRASIPINRSIGRALIPAPTSRALGPDSRNKIVASALTLAAVPPEALYIGAGILAGIGALIGWQMNAANASTTKTEEPAQPVEELPPPIPRENAVLVLGATGRLGRRVVQQLLKAGRTVVAGARTSTKAQAVYGDLGIVEGYQPEGSGILFVQEGVDVTRPETLTAELFEGVTQVVTCLGGVFGPLPGGGMGYIDNMSPERVEAQGMGHVVAAMKQHMQISEPSETEFLGMRSEADMAQWERLDDVIMGGQSSSGLLLAEDGSGAVWRGQLIVEGGGFCGTRSVPLNLDLSAYDGITMRVKGDGQIFKMNIKTADQENVPESTYQATFDTDPAGDWTTVKLPWHNFVPVKRAQSDPDGAPLDPSRIAKLGLVLSRFEFNKMPNPRYKPGPFELRIDGGLRAYKEPRPQLLAISSAGVERNARVGDDEEKRKREIPIVQLNPGGVLNHKYAAEITARSSGLPYTVIRCTGLVDPPADAEPAAPTMMEAGQGDIITGQLSREQAAATVAACLALPEAAYKTFELRASEAADAKGRAMGVAEYRRMVLGLALDRNRWRAGLQPFPAATAPPAPPSEQRKQEILADPRVQAAAQRDREAKAREQQRLQQQEQQEAAPAEKELVRSNA